MQQNPRALRRVQGTIFSIDQTAVHDGPGVRMNVYLKGCPLRCTWCHSPESQSFSPEVVWYETRCARCGRCVEACPEGIRSLGLIDEQDRARCRLCGVCVEVCPNGALEITGRKVEAGAIADEAVRLQPFFRRTGGGVTLTGGEPAAQPEFSFAVASLCQSADIHTAMETCGLVEWGVLERLAEAVDLFLYDVKHADPGIHEQYTGAPNDLILANLGRLAKAGAEVIARVPLIPAINDDPETVRAIARCVADLGVSRVTLLPFNPATPGKYSWVRRQAPLEGAGRQTAEHLARLQRAVEGEGAQVVRA
jgi:pyruvate formate lyase activating enzyme